ncbi:hypothetical protein [Xanthomonas arboricola]|uniref:hypothetical protein n=1 Tax=Xanthomonas arboricola TaxID=56448 RepID=UPI001ADA7D71|nr:hypothetical protein [Xanthomonas arboricola]
MRQHHTYATQLATPLVGSSLKTKASQTRQIVSTTSLRDAVWNSEQTPCLFLESDISRDRTQRIDHRTKHNLPQQVRLSGKSEI